MLSSHLAMTGCQSEIAHQPPICDQTLLASPGTSTLCLISVAEAAPASAKVIATKLTEKRLNIVFLPNSVA